MSVGKGTPSCARNPPKFPGPAWSFWNPWVAMIIPAMIRTTSGANSASRFIGESDSVLIPELLPSVESAKHRRLLLTYRWRPRFKPFPEKRTHRCLCELRRTPLTGSWAHKEMAGVLGGSRGQRPCYLGLLRRGSDYDAPQSQRRFPSTPALSRPDLCCPAL